MITGTADTVGDAAVEIEITGVVGGCTGLIGAHEQLAHDAGGAGSETERAGDAEITGVVLHLNPRIRRQVDRVGDCERREEAQLADGGIRLERAAVQGDGADARDGICGCDTEGDVRLDGRGTAVGHRHIKSDRTAAVVDVLIGTAHVAGH